MKPTISVIMSTYNESIEEIQKSTESILMQSYDDFEFIIVIDNPNNSCIIKYLSEIHDDRVKIIKNTQNIGLVASLNKALDVAEGKYIARMDADDISDTNRLEEQLQYLIQNNLDIVGTYIDYIDENDKLLPINFNFLTDSDMIKRNILIENQIVHPTYFVKREVYEKLKGYRSINYCEDYDFLLRANKLGFKMGNYPKICLHYRIRKESISRNHTYDQKMITKYLIDHYESLMNITEKEIYLYTSSFSYSIKKLYDKVYNLIHSRILYVLGEKNGDNK